jgi:hypothetical protein
MVGYFYLVDNFIFKRLDSTSVKVHPDAFGCLKKRQAGSREVVLGLEY